MFAYPQLKNFKYGQYFAKWKDRTSLVSRLLDRFATLMD